ncbi:MAG TPA: DegV family protein [Acidimicrobiales bacterium]|nr:DegV family protein [Acidimicrobiales bacterium]
MPGIHVVSDSGCDLPPEIVDEHQIAIVPLMVRFGAEELTDLTAKEFWARCRRTSVLPETSAPSPGSFAEAFRDAAAAGAEGVVCVNLSSRLSATIQSAQAAAKEVADVIAVRVVDSLNVSLGEGLLVLAAAQLVKEGKDLEAVADAVEAMVTRTRVIAVLDTLDNLKKGGRIGGARALLGSVLSIKPVIQLVDGVVEQVSKQRTRSRSLRYLADEVAKGAASDHFDRLAVMHGDAADLDEFVDLLIPLVPRERLLIAWVGPVIGTHAGPGVVGCAWLARP